MADKASLTSFPSSANPFSETFSVKHSEFYARLEKPCPQKSSAAAFILAAGHSTRMKLGYSKVLAPLGGQRMIDYVVQTARAWAKDIYLVISPDMQDQLGLLDVHYVIQENPRGTGHAVQLAFQKALSQDKDILSKDILIMCGDVPLVTAEDLRPLMEPLTMGNVDLVVVGFQGEEFAKTYGRILVDEHENGGGKNAPSKAEKDTVDDHFAPLNRLVSIVEAKDAQPEHEKITLYNSGVMRIRGAYAAEALPTLQPSSKTGEYYLTSLIQSSARCKVLEIKDDGKRKTGDEGSILHFLGANTPEELQRLEQILQTRFRKKAQEQGAFFIDPQHVYLSWDTFLGSGVVVHPFVFFGPGVVVEAESTILSFSVLSGCHLEKKVSVGPFAHVRPGTQAGEHSVIGNFVEIKNTILGYASQAKHLSYLGDSHIGQHVNLGAGVVTCNYDGHEKHVTHIQDRAFIGSHSCLVAPVYVGENATVGAGSIITHSVQPHTLSLSRAPQRSIELPITSKHLKRKIKHKKQELTQNSLEAEGS